jgi:hypothetical protein
VKGLILGLAVVLFVVYAMPVWACDCDTATGIIFGVPDRLHQPWPNDPELSKTKEKKPDNGPKQEVQPANQGEQPNGENKK